MSAVQSTVLSGVRAVLLDMDGTLIDSDAVVERAWSRWAREYGVDPALLTGAHGRTSAATIGELAPWLDVQAAAQRQIDLQLEDPESSPALPGAHDLLALLDRLGLPWAVVTGADVPLARHRLCAAGIAPPLLITSEDVAHSKPAPDGYLLAAERLAVSPSACLVVEDTVPGIESGRRAGAKVAALRGLPADLTLTALSELIALLDGLR